MTAHNITHSIIHDGSTFTLTVNLDSATCYERYANGPYKRDETFPLSNLTKGTDTRLAVLVMDYAEAAAKSYHRRYQMDTKQTTDIKSDLVETP